MSANGHEPVQTALTAPRAAPMAPAETSAAAAAASAKALVEARYIMALQRPRDWDTVRERLLRDCDRPAFAEVALWRRPVGGGKMGEGLSIRFMEAAARAMTNIDAKAPTTYDDDNKRIVSVIATDLEANLTYQQDITIPKVVDRRQPRDGDDVLGSRQNSEGKMVYVVRASEDALTVKQAALVSKATRTCIGRLLPGDIADECAARIRKTRADADATDPDAARKKIADAFASVNVPVAELKAFLGHDLASCAPAEVEELRGIYAAIQQGETTWREVRGERDAEREPSVGETPVDRHMASVRGQLERRARHAQREAVDPAVETRQTVEPPPAEPTIAEHDRDAEAIAGIDGTRSLVELTDLYRAKGAEWSSPVAMSAWRRKAGTWGATLAAVRRSAHGGESDGGSA